jgi:hypothetical protein
MFPFVARYDEVGWLTDSHDFRGDLMKDLYERLAEVHEALRKRGASATLDKLFAENAGKPAEVRLNAAQEELRKLSLDRRDGRIAGAVKKFNGESHNGTGGAPVITGSAPDIPAGVTESEFAARVSDWKDLLRKGSATVGVSESDLTLAAQAASGSRTAALQLRARRGDEAARMELLLATDDRAEKLALKESWAKK